MGSVVYAIIGNYWECNDELAKKASVHLCDWMVVARLVPIPRTVGAAACLPPSDATWRRGTACICTFEARNRPSEK